MIVHSGPNWRLIEADVRLGLASLADSSVHCVVTSPPYWGLRDYGFEGQIGSEETIEEYVAAIVEVMRGVRRVLRDDGTMFLNLGDTYSSSGGQLGGGSSDKETRRAAPPKRKIRHKLPAGNLCGIPWRVALALQDDGWILRKDIIWFKPSAMPESVKGWRWRRCRIKIDGTGWTKETHPQYIEVDSGRNRAAIYGSHDNTKKNEHAAEYELCPGCEKCLPNNGYVLVKSSWRPSTDHEMIFMFTKTGKYFCDGDSSKEPAIQAGRRRSDRVGGNKHNETKHSDGEIFTGAATRNLRSVWRINSESYEGAHFACVDDQTEALTKTGWKRHAELHDGEMIACFDREADRLRWSAATFHRYMFDGTLTAIEKRDCSQRLTDNHRCLVKKRNHNGYDVRVVEAANLNSRMSVPMCANWVEESSRSIGVTLAELIGWYVAEGEKRRGNIVRINQSQSANPRKVERIRSLLVAMGALFKEYRRQRIISDRLSDEVTFAIRGEVCLILEKCCPQKRIPYWSVDLPLEESQAMLDGLIDGDGHRRKDGRAAIIQKEKESIEIMQMLAIRCGYRANLSPRTEGGFALFLTKGRWLTLRRTGGAGIDVTKEKYTGIVWCPSVGNGFWLARRGGIPFITGNTFPTELVKRALSCATSRAGCCEICGVQYPPVVHEEDIPTRSGEFSGSNQVSRHLESPYQDHKGSIIGNRDPQRHQKVVEVVGFKPACACQAGAVRPVVLDPFSGSATTGQVAINMNCEYIGCEGNADYIKLAIERLNTPWRPDGSHKDQPKPPKVHSKQRPIVFED